MAESPADDVSGSARAAANEDRFLGVAMALPMGLHTYRLEEDDRLVFAGANAAADEILGIDNSAFVGMLIEDAFPPLIGTEIPDVYRRLAREGGVWRNEQIEYEDDKISGAFQVVAFQIKQGEAGALFWDITEKLKAEEEMRRLMAALNAMGESVLITDNKGTIQYVNPCFVKLTGYSPEELVGQPIGTIKSGKHDEAFYAKLWQALLRGETWSGTFINKRKDGSLFTESATISPVHDTQGTITNYVAVKRDITEHLDLERRVMRSQKMASLGQFAHRVAHDITNFLVVISGSSQLLPEEKDLKNVEEIAGHISEAADGISSLTSDLMSFAIPSKARIKRCRLDRLVRNMKDIISRICGPRIKVEMEIADEVWIRGDPEQLEQAIVHVVVNATEAIAGRGRILIRLSEGTIATPADESLTDPEPVPVPCAILEIQDSGEGLSEEECVQAFEPFFTTKRDLRRNAGLGLATVYSIIDNHSGDVRIESTQETGTVVRIAIPLAP